MRIPWMFVCLSLLTGCTQEKSPSPGSATPPPLVVPATFAQWPSVMEQPVQTLPDITAYCRPVSREETQAHAEKLKAKGPHAPMPIRVRVSPEHFAAFQAGQPLPEGAIIVKEKYDPGSNPMRMREYGLMIKREKGFHPDGGDWEYAFVTVYPEPKTTRGRMAECADCHAQASDRDFLFKNYLPKAK